MRKHKRFLNRFIVLCLIFVYLTKQMGMTTIISKETSERKRKRKSKVLLNPNSFKKLDVQEYFIISEKNSLIPTGKPVGLSNNP